MPSSRVAEHRRVVDGDPAIESDDPALGGDDERVDLGGAGLDPPGHPGEPDDRRGEPLLCLAANADLSPQLAGCVVGEPLDDVVGQLGNRLGVGPGNLLDPRATARRDEEHGATTAVVEDDPGVVLGTDREPLLDEHLDDREVAH